MTVFKMGLFTVRERFMLTRLKNSKIKNQSGSEPLFLKSNMVPKNLMIICSKGQLKDRLIFPVKENIDRILELKANLRVDDYKKAGMPAITPLTTKSERCYNHPPL